MAVYKTFEAGNVSIGSPDIPKKVVKFNSMGKNYFWPRPYLTVGKSVEKYENPNIGQYMHDGTLYWGYLIRGIDCKHPFFDLGIPRADFGQIWPILAKIWPF